MSDTDVHIPWKYTQRGREFYEMRDKRDRGEITHGQYMGFVYGSGANWEDKFEMPKRAKEVRRQFNRRDRRQAKDAIRRSQTKPCFRVVEAEFRPTPRECFDPEDAYYMYEMDDFEMLLFFEEMGLFDYCDEKELEKLPSHATGRNNLRYYLW